MLDISWGELVLIGMVALVVIGPKELPTVLRTVGQWMTKIRRMASEFQGQFNEAMREAEFADLKKEVDSLGEQAKGFTDLNPLETARREMETAFDERALTPSGTSNSASTSPSNAAGTPPNSASEEANSTIAPPPSSEPAESARAALDGATPAPAEPAPERAPEPAASGGRAA